jgi:hypothetical protein
MLLFVCGLYCIVIYCVYGGRGCFLRYIDDDDDDDVVQTKTCSRSNNMIDMVDVIVYYCRKCLTTVVLVWYRSVGMNVMGQ